MARTSNIQLRAHCQCCGREQAVVNGTMAKHGYTVEHGWFQGVCPGQHFAPVEVSREQLDAVVRDVTAQCANLRKAAVAYRAGTKSPAEARSGERVQVEKKATFGGGMRKVWEEEMVPFAQAPEHYQIQAREQAAWNAQHRAEIGEQFCKDMLSIAAEFHGKPIIEIQKPEPLPPIKPGEQRKLGSGTVVTVRRTEGPRVIWEYTPEGGVKRQGWTGIAAFRKLEKI